MKIVRVNNIYFLKSMNPIMFTNIKEEALQLEDPEESVIITKVFNHVKYTSNSRFSIEFEDYVPGVVLTLDDISQLLSVPIERIFLKDIPIKHLIFKRSANENDKY